jgi:integrase
MGAVLAKDQPIRRSSINQTSINGRTPPETANRLRGRIERVLDAAKAQGLRTGENPARWRGHLDQLLPKRQRLARGHHAAMPYADLPAFMATLRACEGTAARALEFTILTAARSGEVFGARWDEFDLTNAIWTVSAPRMKGGRAHRVPLSGRALKIIASMPRHSEFVFQPLATRAMENVLERMKIENATVHGFRSTFRDWAAECTDYSREICEAALAHAVGDKVEAAYRRGDLFEKRRRLMDEWAEYAGKIVRLAAA